MAAQLYAADEEKETALAWRIKHAYEVGVIGQPSKVRFAAVEIANPESITRAEAHTRDLGRLLAKERLDARDTSVSQPTPSTSWDADMNRQLEALTKVTADLLAVVAAQQREIEELRQLLNAATLARVQTEITKLAQDHHHALFSEARETIGTLGSSSGEVAVGEIEHRGSLVVRLVNAQQDAQAATQGSRDADASKVDIAAEVRGLAARIASVGVDLGAETSKVHERADAVELSRSRNQSQQYEGTFETRQKGATIRWTR